MSKPGNNKNYLFATAKNLEDHARKLRQMAEDIEWIEWLDRAPEKPPERLKPIPMDHGVKTIRVMRDGRPATQEELEAAVEGRPLPSNGKPAENPSVERKKLNMNGWIPVEDSMPRPQVEVYFLVDGISEYLGHLTSAGAWDGGGFLVGGQVTAWRPKHLLPELPPAHTEL